MSAPHHCDPEPIFELADGSLGPEREREVRTHLRECQGCRNLYERELRLNASLGSLDFEQPRSVCQGVAMALPTRSLRARLLWAGLAVVLLLTTSVTMMLGGSNFAAFFVEAVGVFWGFVADMADVIQVVFAVVGPALLVALAVGAVVDLAIAAVYLAFSRRRAREV
jgi:predicted anti-sigma-YlaC factor YlaD